LLPAPDELLIRLLAPVPEESLPPWRSMDMTEDVQSWSYAPHLFEETGAAEAIVEVVAGRGVGDEDVG
jgi:hypothetical protein